MNSAAFHSRRRRIAHALANHSNLSLRVDVDVGVVLALIHARVGRSRSRSRARSPSRCQTFRSSQWVDRSIDDRDPTRSNSTSRRTRNRLERNGTEPNRTERGYRTLGGGVSRSRARSFIHHSRIFAFIPFVDANGRARDDDTTKNSHQFDVSCVKYDTSSRDRCMCVSREAC